MREDPSSKISLHFHKETTDQRPFPHGLPEDLLKLSSDVLFSSSADWFAVLSIKPRQEIGKDWPD